MKQLASRLIGTSGFLLRRQRFGTSSHYYFRLSTRYSVLHRPPQPCLLRYNGWIRQNHTRTDEISIQQYHQKADDTLEAILGDLETLAESLYPKLDVELSQGVMTVELPPAGTYVINKQPPNKQIWLSSPISGPKRYDLVNSKWTNLRDGTTLGDLLREEVSKVTNSKVKFADVDK